MAKVINFLKIRQSFPCKALVSTSNYMPKSLSHQAGMCADIHWHVSNCQTNVPTIHKYGPTKLERESQALWWGSEMAIGLFLYYGCTMLEKKKCRCSEPNADLLTKNQLKSAHPTSAKSIAKQCITPAINCIDQSWLMASIRAQKMHQNRGSQTLFWHSGIWQTSVKTMPQLSEERPNWPLYKRCPTSNTRSSYECTKKCLAKEGGKVTNVWPITTHLWSKG